MQKTASLNCLYADYSAGFLEKKELEGAIFKTILDNSYQLPGWDRDDRYDYISWLYPRISRAINTYRDTGSSFETYIGTLVRMTAKEYRLRKIRNYTAESAAWITQLPEMYACENEPEYNNYIVPDREIPSKFNNPRQLLILILKCCRYVSDDFLEKVSPGLGIKTEELNEMITRLKTKREKRERNNNLLREKINYQFCRCIFYEKNLKILTEDSIAARQMKKQLERGRNKLQKMRKLLGHRLPDPSNNQIAELLGISKGTVDSTLYTLKSKWNKGQDKILLN